jgi:hypothetical protein
MKVSLADKSIAWLALLSGLSISAVAVYYSVAGLISIFAAAAVPIAVMGVVLELSKLIATIWLKQYWFIAPRLIKAYLLIAVAILMLITSMGIFGYLSKAHLDQAVPTGDVQAQVSLIDEKIKTERDNIEAAKKALQQMDAQVDQMLSRGDTERSAERAVQIRKNQAKERAGLQKDIAAAQQTIATLNIERAPIASELRKVEAEVGPIKYIAALLYGDSPDQNLLEKAVRWVIILIVVIFDPLAVVMLLASQYSFQWFRKNEEDTMQDEYDFSEGQRGAVINDDETGDNGLPPTPVDDNIVVLPENEDVPNNAAVIDVSDDGLDHIPKQSVDVDDIAAMGIIPPDDYMVRKWTADEIAALDGRIEEVKKDLEDDDDAETDAKRSWKAANPHDTIKRQRVLYEKGLIENLPWETVETFDAENAIDEQPSQTPETVDRSDELKKKDELHSEREQSTDQEKEVGYVQNAEQNQESIWHRIKKLND